MTSIIVSDGYEVINNPSTLEARKGENDKVIAALVTNCAAIQGVDEIYQISEKDGVADLVKIANNVI